MTMSRLNNKISHTIYQTVEKGIGFLTNIHVYSCKRLLIVAVRLNAVTLGIRTNPELVSPTDFQCFSRHTVSGKHL